MGATRATRQAEFPRRQSEKGLVKMTIWVLAAKVKAVNALIEDQTDSE